MSALHGPRLRLPPRSAPGVFLAFFHTPLTSHHIVCGDTVDGDVLSALKRKDTTQQNLIAAVKAQLTG